MSSPAEPIRIGIVVGEASGDVLGAGLMAALQQRLPQVQFEGMGGDKMQALGMRSMFSIERLAVMGLVEPLKRLPELLGMRKQLINHFIDNPPHAFIGIDAPDFNLGLERALKTAGIPTVHYVSPSVWAWRQNRIHKIKRSVDMMLCLLPFEAAFYRQHQAPHCFVGHPLAQELPFTPLAQIEGAAQVCLMAGSRRSEVECLAPVYFGAATLMLEHYPDLQFVLPAANESRLKQLRALLRAPAYASLASRIHLQLGEAHTAMAQSHVVICTSGTTTLEAMLLGKPMVIAYKASALNYWLLHRFFKAKFFGLPNLLADQLLVTELLQDQATAESVAAEAVSLLNDGARRQSIIARFEALREMVAVDSNELAANAVLQVMGDAS